MVEFYKYILIILNVYISYELIEFKEREIINYWLCKIWNIINVLLNNIEDYVSFRRLIYFSE